jgi:hypothetical protein
VVHEKPAFAVKMATKHGTKRSGGESRVQGIKGGLSVMQARSFTAKPKPALHAAAGHVERSTSSS